jgi:uncharacterized membrane protein YfcA
MLIAALIAVFIGVSLGLLGGGGSILTVPLFVHVLGMPSKEAIATSLLVVGVTSLAAMVPHARAGNVRWRTAGIFGASAMFGAYGGGAVARFIPGTVLLVLFALLMLVTAAAMWRGRKESSEAQASHGTGKLSLIVAEGAVVGFATGLVGAGGGFLVVPALVLLGGLPMQAAIGTSLVVIAMKSAAGFAGYASHVPVRYELAGVVIAAAVAGSVVGSLLASRVPAQKLRQGFAALVVVMGLGTLYGEIGPAVVERVASHGTAIAISLTLVAVVLGGMLALVTQRRAQPAARGFHARFAAARRGK